MPSSGLRETCQAEKVSSINLRVSLQKIVIMTNKYFDKGALLDLWEIKLRIFKSH